MSAGRTRTRTFAEVQAGEELPPLAIDVTTRLIVTAAIATRDFQDVHHDKDAAQALGSPDIFMNILTTNGLVGRYVTDWAGPEALLRSVKIRLGAPNYPGDTMVLAGKVTAADAAERVVQIEVEGRNRLGPHVTGSVAVVLP